MRARVLLVILGAALLTGAPRALARELVYVASADSGPVYGYDAAGRGAVRPLTGFDNPGNPSTVWDPWGIAFDRAGDAYVQSFLSDATTFVFAPGAARGAAPLRIFRVYGPDGRSIAVGSAGYEYVASGETASVIAVAQPGAAGAPGASLYSVAPDAQGIALHAG